MGRAPGTRRRRHQDATGAAAVEFALVSVLLFTLLFGMIQYSLYFWSVQSGAQAAREAARQAAVGSLDCAEFVSAVRDNARGETSSTVEATREYYTDATMATTAASAEVGGVVKVTVSFDSIDLGFPFVPFLDDGAVHEEAVARIEHTTADSVACT